MPRTIQLVMDSADVCQVIRTATKVFGLVGQLPNIETLNGRLPVKLFAGGALCISDREVNMTALQINLGDLDPDKLGLNYRQACDNAVVLGERFNGDVSSWQHRDPAPGAHERKGGYTGGAVRIGRHIYSVCGTGDEKLDEAVAMAICFFAFLADAEVRGRIDEIKHISDNPFIWPLLDLGR